jgi:hypothetical protein
MKFAYIASLLRFRACSGMTVLYLGGMRLPDNDDNTKDGAAGGQRG